MAVMVDESARFVTQAPSRLPAKALERDLSPSHPGPRGPLPARITESESATNHVGTGDGQHFRNSRDSRVRSGCITVHRDSGARFPQSMPEPLIDIPPEYTTN